MCVHVPGGTHLCAWMHAYVGAGKAGGGAPSLHTAWVMEHPTLDAEQARELTLGSQLWPCSLSTRS